MSLLKFRKLTLTEWEALSVKDSNTRYMVYLDDGSSIFGEYAGNQLIGAGAGGGYIEIKYADLVELRDTSQLKPGAFYRITDYRTTTVQPETRSAEHLFDIIVQALDEKTLSENASAAYKKRELLPWFEHSKSDYPERFFYVDSIVIEGLTLHRWLSQEDANSNKAQYLLTEMKDVSIGDVVWGYQVIDDGEYSKESYEELDDQKVINNVGEGYSQDYFDGMRLEAWKLKYTLDNDRLKYHWADDVNGKGVIYRMIDEFENDLPYDFKNIQFKRYMIDEYSDNTDLEGKYYALKDRWDDVYPDGAIINEGDFIWAYTFTTRIDSDETYIETTTLNKYIGIHDEEITPYCSKNIFGHKSNLMQDLLDEYNSYVLGNNVIYSEVDEIDEENPMHMYLPTSNTIGDKFCDNTIGYGFVNNTIGYNFNHNTIGNNFSDNTSGDNFYYSTIGNNFYGNTLGDNFYYNTIGNNFYGNTIGNDFNSNIIGNNFNSNTVDGDVRYIQFSVDGTWNNSIRYLYLKSGLNGASSNNRLDLYYDDLYHRTYPTTFEITANNNIVSSWEAAPFTRAGKLKTTKTVAAWLDIISASGGVDWSLNPYFNYASSIYADKQNLLTSAWNHSLTVDSSRIIVDSIVPNIRGKAQYPNGETEGVIIPYGIESIGNYAFYDWKSNNQPLVIPDSVTSIGNGAFYEWSSNNQPFVIPDSVTSIGSAAFNNWTSNNQPLVIPDSVTSIGQNAFSDWTSNNHPLVIPNSVTSIDTQTFNNWTSNDQPLVIPDSVTSIDTNAFRKWESNTHQLVIPNSVTSIGYQVFSDWTSNNQPLVIPDSITSIYSSAFRDWTSNNQPLVIPEGVRTISETSFRNWTSNTHPLILPSSITSISIQAFLGWSLVPYVEMKRTVPPSLTNVNAFDGQNDAPIYVPDASVTAYKTATNWVSLADRIFPISDK